MPTVKYDVDMESQLLLILNLKQMIEGVAQYLCKMQLKYSSVQNPFNFIFMLKQHTATIMVIHQNAPIP